MTTKATPKKATARKPAARKRPAKRVECGFACKDHASTCDMERGHGGMHSHIRGARVGQVFHLYISR